MKIIYKVHILNSFTKLTTQHLMSIISIKDYILLICSPACGGHIDACLSTEECRWICHIMDKGKLRNQPHQIILALDLIDLKFSDILTIDFFFFGIQSSGKWRSTEIKTEPNARLWDGKSNKGAGTGGTTWAPSSWTVQVVCSCNIFQ